MNEENKEEKVMEIKFDSSKEKIFIFFKRYLTTAEVESYLELFKLMNENKVFLLPSKDIDSIKIIRDMKE